MDSSSTAERFTFLGYAAAGTSETGSAPREALQHASVVDPIRRFPYYPARLPAPERREAVPHAGMIAVMCWRKWLVRALVFSVVIGAAGAAFLYSRWTDPVIVRQQVLDRLHQLFPGASVTLDRARLRILGGIVLHELRLVRRDDPDQLELAHVPSAVIYHDKEHLLDGKLAFRKVELQRPRLRVVRDRDGKWNLDGLFAPGPSAEPLPTLVIRQGTLVFEDRLAPSGVTPLEVDEVSLTLINDPLPTVLLEGSGVSDVLGTVRLHGSWQRDTRAVALSLQVEGLPLNPALVQRLSAFFPDKSLESFPLEGRLEIRGEVSYQPGGALPFQYDVHCKVGQGKVQHPKLPLVLEEVEGAFRCMDGWLTAENLKARSGTAQLELVKGKAALSWPPDRDFEAVLTARHLELCESLCSRLPEPIRKLYENFRPSGAAGVRIEAARRDGQWLTQKYSLYPEATRVCFKHFEYPVSEITGVVEYDRLAELARVDIRGKAGKGPVTLRGTWKGADLASEARLELTAEHLPLDESLIQALPEKPQKVANEFQLSGRAQGSSLIRRIPGSKEFHCTYSVRFADTRVRWQPFPYPLENVSGVLNIYPDYWEFKEGIGTHNGGQIAVQARSYPQPNGKGSGAADSRLVVDITGHHIALDDDLKQAVQPKEMLAKTWQTLSPSGRVHFAARVESVPDQPFDVELVLDACGCTVAPSFFRYELTDLLGRVHYRNGRVELAGLTASHRGSRFSLTDAAIDFHPGGGFYAELGDLRGNPVLPDDDFVNALPEALKTTCQTLQIRDPFAAKTRLVVAQGSDPSVPATIFWDGQMWLHTRKLKVGVDLNDVAGTVACRGLYDGRQLREMSGNVVLSRATVFKQPFHEVHASLQVHKEEPEALIVGLKAPLFDGDVSGQARVEFGPSSKLRYELNLTGSQIQLEQFGRHNLAGRAQLSGIAAARLHLTGNSSGVDSLQGNGSVDVPYTTFTKLYNLPLLLDLLKFLGLRWPDRTMFEEAHAAFSIQGERVYVNRLELMGNVVSLWGKGEVNLDGSDIRLDFHPGWARVEQVLPTPIRAVPMSLSKNLLKIEMRGKISDNPSDIKFTKKPIPLLMDPLLQVRDLVIGKKN